DAPDGSVRGDDGIGLACAVEQNRTGHVSRLQRAEALFVAIPHDLTTAVRVIQADGVTDLMGNRVAKIIDLEVPIEADLPALGRVQANQRLGDWLDRLGRGHVVEDIGKCPALWLDLRTDQNVGWVRACRLAERNVGDGLHMRKAVAISSRAAAASIWDSAS